jgi:hypothetical protein
MEIPNLGTLLIKNGSAAVEFDEYLVKDALVINEILFK